MAAVKGLLKVNAEIKPHTDVYVNTQNDCLCTKFKMFMIRNLRVYLPRPVL